ncbi:MAG TPA: hypothetical protein VNV82_09320 [Bryobacteraceae bacterium]|nr:hypothetical protein [Bryobacteraceae bacterium]
MNRVKTKVMLVLGLAVLGAVLPRAVADEWDQKTVFTFSGPVEIPGQVLPAGTYVFKLADSPSDRNIVQVLSKDERHLFGTFLAIPDYRLQPAGRTIITFEERPPGSPEAVKAWFYPGENYGHDFVYPKPKALELAKVNNTPVPSMPAELAPNTLQPATTMQEPNVLELSNSELKAQTPTEEVEITEVFTMLVAAPTDQLPEELPKTASSLPLVGLLGLLSVVTALVLAFVEREYKHGQN